jgi:hypothetical protein
MIGKKTMVKKARPHGNQDWKKKNKDWDHELGENHGLDVSHQAQIHELWYIFRCYLSSVPECFHRKMVC